MGLGMGMGGRCGVVEWGRCMFAFFLGLGLFGLFILSSLSLLYFRRFLALALCDITNQQQSSSTKPSIYFVFGKHIEFCVSSHLSRFPSFLQQTFHFSTFKFNIFFCISFRIFALSFDLAFLDTLSFGIPHSTLCTTDGYPRSPLLFFQPKLLLPLIFEFPFSFLREIVESEKSV